MSAYWYALNSKPNQEDALTQYLRSLNNVDVYYPFLRVKPVNPRSRKIRPYFPGYIFAKFDLEQVGASFIQYSPYIKKIVSYGDDPIPVVDALVEAIRQRVEEINKSGQFSVSDIVPGTRVKILNGLFDGHNAIFDQKISGRDRVRVLITVLNNQGHWLELNSSDIRPLTPAQGSAMATNYSREHGFKR
jgi:transcription antitermination factor NusG